MKSLHDIMDNMIKDLPQQFLMAAIEKKLAPLNVSASKDEIARAARAIIKGKTETLSFTDEAGVAHEIPMTAEELTAVLDQLEKFHKDGIQDWVIATAEDSWKVVYKRLRKTWPRRHKDDVAGDDLFKANLEQRWGKALGRLRMLLTISREWGQDVFERKRQAKSGKMSHLDDVMLRLHVRACQVTSEIVVLLENGYADGAIARWRTLHEITTVALVIAKYGEDMALRYARYQAVESQRAFNAYEASYQSLGYDPPDPKEVASVRRAYEDVLAKYGQDFKEEYGWASHHLGQKRVKLAHLEEAAGQKMMRAHYRMASHNVHAGPKGIYFKLGEIPGAQAMLAGASNAGLFEPAQNTSLSLSKITVTIGTDPKLTSIRFGDLLMGKIITQLVREIPEEFGKAADALERSTKRHGTVIYT